MSNQAKHRRDDDPNLNLETLEHWEAELEDFTNQILRRLSEIATNGPVGQTQSTETQTGQSPTRTSPRER